MKRSISRREFLTRFSRQFEFPTPHLERSSNDGWFLIGRVAQMSPGKKFFVHAGNCGVSLQATNTGIYAETATSKRLALKSGAGGTLFVNPQIEWPAYRVLSHLTGNSIDLETADCRGESDERKKR